MVYVIQYRCGISCWTDDIHTERKYEFNNPVDANAVRKYREQRNPDFEFRVITRDEDGNVLYPNP